MLVKNKLIFVGFCLYIITSITTGGFVGYKVCKIIPNTEFKIQKIIILGEEDPYHHFKLGIGIRFIAGGFVGLTIIGLLLTPVILKKIWLSDEEKYHMWQIDISG